MFQDRRIFGNSYLVNSNLPQAKKTLFQIEDTLYLWP